MTKLKTKVTRETTKLIGSRPIILSIAPAGSQNETLLGLRLKGKRTQYVVALSRLYTYAAMWHAEKEKAARRKARNNGIAWRIAKKQFNQENTI